MITAAMKHTEMAEAAKKHGRSEAEEEAAQEEAAHGHADEHPELNDPNLHWSTEQKVNQGRRALLQNFWRENHDLLWAIDTSVSGLDMQGSVDAFMKSCDQQYKGNFQVMLRNLRHDAMQVRRHSSVEAQMILRPPDT